MECTGCAKPLPPRKRGRRQEYCSDRCRKAAGRAAAQEASEEEKDLIRSLRGSWPVGQLWPVYTWDDSPRIIALIVPKQIALDEFNHAKGGEPFSEAQFTRLLDMAQVVDYHACGKVLDLPRSQGPADQEMGYPYPLRQSRNGPLNYLTF